MYEVAIFEIKGDRVVSSDKLPAICPELSAAEAIAAQVMTPDVTKWKIAEQSALDVIGQDHSFYSPVKGWSWGDLTLCVIEPRKH